MNTKLAVLSLTGISICLSLSAYAIADGDPSEDVNWSYVMATENVGDVGLGSEKGNDLEIEGISVATDSLKNQQIQEVQINDSTLVERHQKQSTQEPLTLTYVDEAAPMPTHKPVVKAYRKCNGNCLHDPMPVQELQPQMVADNTLTEAQMNSPYVQQPVKVQYPITRQYPISVQYPVAVQREITIEQPVVMQQPVIVKRPIVMQQAITVQRKPTYLQQQPMVMQHQPTYIQQKPIVMQAPAGQAPFTAQSQGVAVMTMPQTVYQTSTHRVSQQPVSVSAPSYAGSVATPVQTQVVPAQVSSAVSTQAYVPQMQKTIPGQALPENSSLNHRMNHSVSGQIYQQPVQQMPAYQAQPLQSHVIGNSSAQHQSIQQTMPQIGYGYQVY